MFQEFDGTKPYLEAAATRLDLAAVPIPLAASFLDKTVSTIRRYIKDGKLEAVEISEGGKVVWSGVTIMSLVKLRDQQRAEIDRYVDPMTNVLISCAAKQTTITYSELMGMFGLDHTQSQHRDKVGKILGAISTKTRKNTKENLLLSVVVIGKNSPPLPNKVFFRSV